MPVSRGESLAGAIEAVVLAGSSDALVEFAGRGGPACRIRDRRVLGAGSRP
jgi:hypothetical protein